MKIRAISFFSPPPPPPPNTHTHKSHLSYDRWWCIEHGFLVWANSFVILASHLLPPNYLQILYQCALHLGGWTKCSHDAKASM